MIKDLQNRSFPPPAEKEREDGGISQLRKFKSCLEKENWEYLNELIEGANKIKRIIK